VTTIDHQIIFNGVTIMKSLLWGLFASLSLTSIAQAATIHDEFSGDGDLSNDSLNPTILDLSFGSNVIIGSTESGPNGSPEIGPDFFTVTLQPGQFLSSITLIDYVGRDDVGVNQSFFAVQNGTSIAQQTIINNEPPLLGGALIGANLGTQEGDNILDDLGVSAPIQGQSFIGFNPLGLGPGSYTFWLQETAGEGIQRYEIDLVVTSVPEPSTTIGIITILSMGLFMNRKKS
jgi:hypothetical protein